MSIKLGKVGESLITLGNLIKSEYGTEYGHCRKTVTLYNMGTDEISVSFGELVGQADGAGVADIQKLASNIGGSDATVTFDVKAGARTGIYSIVFTTDTDFVVAGPMGFLGEGEVGVALDLGEVEVTITNGSDSFQTNDKVFVQVYAIEGYILSKGDATDGTEVAAGVIIDDEIVVEAGGQAEATIMFQGPALLAYNAIKFDATYATDAEKEAALATLQANGIKFARQIPATYK